MTDLDKELIDYQQQTTKRFTKTKQELLKEQRELCELEIKLKTKIQKVYNRLNEIEEDLIVANKTLRMQDIVVEVKGVTSWKYSQELLSVSHRWTGLREYNTTDKTQSIYKQRDILVDKLIYKLNQLGWKELE